MSKMSTSHDNPGANSGITIGSATEDLSSRCGKGRRGGGGGGGGGRRGGGRRRGR